MHTLILAGGLGSRLSNRINDLPKILAPIGSRTLLEIQIENWMAQGLDEFIFLLGYKHQMVVDELERTANRLGKQFHYSVVIEKTQLGTGGSVKQALMQHSEVRDFILLNGDTILKGDITPVLISDMPAIGVVFQENVTRFGLVELANDKKITNFTEKSSIETTGLINAGIYKLNRRDLLSFQSDTFSLENEVLPHLVEQNKLLGQELEVSFIDVGVPEDYEKLVTLLSEKNKNG